ncbi:hypothetical protein K9M41_01090 [Candidatus Gracilibacteria bacterium]|nr:hypothetical protein [Candidatus Gracilibacteria bacterium]
MKNPFRIADWTVSRIILVVWVVFSLVYVANDLKNGLITRVYQAGQEDGTRSAVVQAISLAQQCQPVVLRAGETAVNLLNPACGAKAESEKTMEQ